jgi:CheY-like chemotaxis protein
MEQQLDSEHKDEQQQPELSVLILGFEVRDEDSFKRYFQPIRPNLRNYSAVASFEKAHCDIMMVNYDNPEALKVKETILINHPEIPVVAVSRGPLAEPPLHHIRGMLFAARVLTTLDKVVISKVSAASNMEQEVIAIQPSPSAEVATEKTSHNDEQDDNLHAHSKPALPPETVSEDTSLKLKEQVSTDKDGYRVLVVDDSLAIQKSLEINLVTLPQIGTIDFADSGEIALEKAESVRYDLIFLDVMMPGIDGYETCTRLRKQPDYKKTPIIMVSGKTSPMDEVKGVMAGCTTYLTKPVQQEAFKKLSVRVLTWLEKLNKP